MSADDAKKNATYYGKDMRWMIWEGADDYIFPANQTMTTYHNVFAKLGVLDTWKIQHIEPGMGHWYIQKEFDQMKTFFNGETDIAKASEVHWENYTVDGLAVTSVTADSEYSKVLIMLHGGGGSGEDWVKCYNYGMFGDISGMKLVFPTTNISTHVWYISYKNGCGLDDDCAYDLNSIRDSGSRVKALIEHEMQAANISPEHMFLAGFSQGAQLTSYVQICQLDFPLGGAIVMDGYPLPPLIDMPNVSEEEAKKLATYYGNDMRWMIWEGEDDYIFPPNKTMTTY